MKQKEPKEPHKDAPFNMGLVFIFRINDMIAAKNKASIDNDLMRWYFIMREIYTDTIFYFDDDEREKFNLLFNGARMMIWTKNSSIDRLEANIQLNAPLIRDKLELVWIELNIQLFKRGLIFPKLDYTPMIDKISARYGLPSYTGVNL